jgi:putative drug exporter of the RND superfamily
MSLAQCCVWNRAGWAMFFLGIAVLLDAMLVQLMLVPIRLRLTGRADWWLPRWLDRLLSDVRFRH